MTSNSNSRAKRQERDAFLAQVFATAKLPLVRVPARQAFTLNDVSGLLMPHFKGSSVAAPLTDEEEAAWV
jgi:hypothetical protein